MLQVRLDAQPGAMAPPDTFLSMRVGDVQKQTRFAESRTYRFPESTKDPRGSFARIEVFKRVGSTTVCLDSDENASTSVHIPCSFPGLENLSLNMSVTGAASDRPVSREQKKKTRVLQRMDEAQQYLSSYKLEETLADAMREVIRERPDDPYKYLSAVVLKKSGMPPSPTKSKFSPELTQKPFQAKAEPPAASTYATASSVTRVNEETPTKAPTKATTPTKIAPTKAVLPFSAYHKANFQSVVANIGLYSKFHAKPVDVQKPAIATPIKTLPQDSRKPAIVAAPTKAVLPFSAYHKANFQSVVANIGLYSKFHSKPTSIKKPAVAKTQAVLPFSSYHKANFQSVVANIGLYSKFHSKPVDVKKPAVAKTQADSKPGKMAILPFSTYYSQQGGSNFASVLMDIQIYSKFHDRPVHVPKVPPLFSKMPSVGTWLGYKPAIKDSPGGLSKFRRLPSVGTWLVPLQPRQKITSPTELQVSEDFSRVPFLLSPSVGTWLMKESPDVPRAWYFQQRHHGEHTDYVRDLQKVIATRDDELETLRKQLAKYEGS